MRRLCGTDFQFDAKCETGTHVIRHVAPRMDKRLCGALAALKLFDLRLQGTALLLPRGFPGVHVSGKDVECDVGRVAATALKQMEQQQLVAANAAPFADEVAATKAASQSNGWRDRRGSGQK